MSDYKNAVKECNRFVFDAVWGSNWQTTVQIEIRTFQGNVEIEVSNIVGSTCQDDETFEETAVMSPAQFKAFAAACKAMADTL